MKRKKLWCGCLLALAGLTLALGNRDTAMAAALSEGSAEEYTFGYVDAPEAEEWSLPEEAGRSLTEEKKDLIVFSQEKTYEALRTAIPAFYDAREHGQVSSVKNQNPYGTCWSFSAIAAIESSLMSKGIMETPDLSELHLIRYGFYFQQDPLGGTYGDSVYYYGSDLKNAGNNIQVAYHALADWIGAVKEEDAVYPGSDDQSVFYSHEDAYYKDLVHLQQMYYLDLKDADRVKQAIMEYGGLTGAMYYKEIYMNPENGAYYCETDMGAHNHAITIVGWDDNYSRDHFKTDPHTDGAWLIKNSWGSDFADGGYLWISYADKNLDDTCAALIAEKADNYDKNYQYDGSYLDSKLLLPDNTKAANVFEVSEDERREEKLEAVSFVTGNGDVSYQIRIYLNPENPADPESGEEIPEAKTSGWAEFAGYHTVRLENPVTLYPGDRFAVVITFSSGEQLKVVIEKSGTWNSIECKASAETGQSFVKKPSGDWIDVAVAKGANLRIKAFTTIGEEVPAALPFTDVSRRSWQFPYVSYVYENGIMKGFALRTFGPNEKITRAEFVTVLYNMAEKPTVSYEEVYSDVPDGKWFTEPVMWARQNGIAVGYGDSFGVSDPITRQQMIKMLYAYSKESYEMKEEVLRRFEDAGRVSNWAKEAVCWSAENGIIAGKPLEEGKMYVDPLGNATRAECAAVIRKIKTKNN